MAELVGMEEGLGSVTVINLEGTVRAREIDGAVLGAPMLMTPDVLARGNKCGGIFGWQQRPAS